MRKEHLSLLVCPTSQRPLRLEVDEIRNGSVQSGFLVEDVGGLRYPIVEFVPRFVVRDNYANSFGFEWQTHSRTQYDDETGIPASQHRFEKETRWGANLVDEVVLEIGGGSGRFTQQALKTGATVVSIDYSDAVNANYASNGSHPNLLLVQANVFAMPFLPERFSRAFCFGVLQHTPDPRSAFLAMVDKVQPGGRIASDIYVKDLRHWALQTKYWVRPFINREDPDRLYRHIKRYVDALWPVAKLIRQIPGIGYAINWRLLIADYSKLLPSASDSLLREWAYLDTFDMLSPEYDYPQTVRTFRSWHEHAGLSDIDVGRGFNGVEGRATKPAL